MTDIHRWERSAKLRRRGFLIAIAMPGALLCFGGAPAAESRSESLTPKPMAVSGEQHPHQQTTVAFGSGLNEDSRMSPERPTLLVPMTNSKPVVDGKLDEPCWKAAAGTGRLKGVLGEPPKSTMEAFILRDADHLYVGVRCAVEWKAESDKPSKETEIVELLIDSNGDQNSYYSIRIANQSGGTISSSYNEHEPPWRDRTWQPQLKSALTTGEGVWTVEAAIPFDVLNKNKTLTSEVGFNITRSGIPGGEAHCWRGTSTDPGQWGTLTGIPARVNLPKPDYGTRGLNRWYRPPNKAGRAFLAGEERRTITLGPGSAHHRHDGRGTVGTGGLPVGGRSTRAGPHLGPRR